MPIQVVTIDFHVTSECSQECPYCWGPQDFKNLVSTDAALEIIDQVKDVGAQRIVYTGGDPLKRADIGRLIQHAKGVGLEIALSITGDGLTAEFLGELAAFIDLISLPLDGSNEEVNVRTKKEGHYGTNINALEWLRAYPQIDVKPCTPVTRHNLTDVPNIVHLIEDYACSTKARVFYNIFQAFPRSMVPRQWGELLVTNEEFLKLKDLVGERSHLKINFLTHETLDRLYVMIFPDGSLVIISGPDFLSYGPFLEIEDLEAVISSSQFNAAKHLRHSLSWMKKT